MNKTVEISVLMSVFNGEKYLNEAIQSILNQTFESFEFIIINDGSIDSSLEIIKAYNDKRIVLIDKKNEGLPKALNAGLEIAKGKYIARMDADDICYPNRLKLQFDFLETNPDVIIVGSNADIIDMEGNFIHKSNIPLNQTEIKNKFPFSPFIHPSVMYRTSVAKDCGGYPEYMLKAQDTVFFNRMSKHGRLYNFQESLLKYRIVPTANSLRNNNHIKTIMKIVHKAIEYDKISDEDFALFKSILSNRESSKRYFDYYIHIAKKFLWNNYNPKLARKNLRKAIGIDFLKVNVYLLYLLSFLNKNQIAYIYKKLK